MRWWLSAVTLVACESASDFPSTPTEIPWHTRELATVRGTLDGTTYQVDIPRGAQETVVGRTATFTIPGLTVTIELDQEARTPDDFPQFDKTLRDDGWSGGYAGSELNYVYVDDGGLACTAASGIPTNETIERMRRICGSLRATSALANPAPYPAGLSPREVRAAMCQLAMQHVRALEPAPSKKKKPTKEQRAAEALRAEELDAAYSARRTRCERHRWTTAQLNCVQGALREAEARLCIPADW